MSELVVGFLAAIGTAVVASVYWRRRLGRVRRGILASRERDERVQTTTTPREGMVLQKAAAKAECEPEDLPERIEEFRRNLADKERTLKRTRRTWASAWRDACEHAPAETERPRVASVELEGGTIDDATALVGETQQPPQEIVIITARGDDTVVVGVGEGLREVVTATEILDDVLAIAGGDGGGTDALATGGGAEYAALREAVAEVVPRVERSVRPQSE